MNSNNTIVSPVTLFNIDEDIQHNYINATLTNLQINLLNFYIKEFEKKMSINIIIILQIVLVIMK